MFRNYFKIAVRSVLKQKGLSFINLFGLSVGIACFSMFLLYAINEFTFDSFHKKAKNIFRVYQWTEAKGNEEAQGMSYHPMPLGPALKEEFPDIIQSVRIKESWGPSFIKSGDVVSREDVTFADASFFNVFSFKLKSGDASTVLHDAHSIVLTEETAKKLFGKGNPVGKTIEIKVFDRFDPFSVGILFSIIGTFFVRISENAGTSTSVVQKALNMGNWGSIILTAIASYFLVNWILPDGDLFLRGFRFTKIDVFGSIAVGLVVGTLMSIITEYYTAMGKRPVLTIVRQSGTGHATNVIGGLAVGMESTLLPILVLAGGIYGSYAFAGLYGVAIAAAGMMATTAMQLAIDAFGPIADNAGGIAEMSELPKDVREKTDTLDAVGNTTAATGKGFAIASAALTALALFAAFVGVVGIKGIDIYKADVLASLFVGGMIPFIFSSLAIQAVGKAAMAMVEEVRRQFRDIPGIMEGKGKPEYDKCVAISTEASIRKMLAPGAIAIVSPLIIGFLLGPEALGGFLAGATVSGVLMGMFQNNAGGAWDNAKKSFEKGVDINGTKYYKGSEPHKASVTGDTVGDPFKDTSGPSMNILIKLMSIVSLVIAPTLAHIFHTKNNPTDAAKAVKIQSSSVSASKLNASNTYNLK